MDFFDEAATLQRAHNRLRRVVGAWRSSKERPGKCRIFSSGALRVEKVGDQPIILAKNQSHKSNKEVIFQLFDLDDMALRLAFEGKGKEEIEKKMAASSKSSGKKWIDFSGKDL